MFDFIIGDIVHVDEDYIVLLNNNIGFHIKINTNKLMDLKDISNIKVFTEFVVREDEVSILGFLEKDERKIYRMLTQVKGIGPKVAMGILSALEIQLIRQSILTEDSKILMQAPGIGKKSADRIILELKDKISKVEFDSNISLDQLGETQERDLEFNPALEALITLGYNKYEAQKVLNKVDLSLNVEEVIKEALKLLAR